ncbi:MAG: RraA family protein, partial [Planctomycetota bacterium]|jgi:regulator of RNase E activity RraA|nr:RraA family protein [Planctomycetota bacterium]
VAVNPGDYILGDDDGVVAIPRALGVEVLEKAETKAETEREMRKALAEGMKIAEVFAKFGRF